MAEVTMWVHFEFNNGSNPYIATRTDTFFYMVCKYYIYQVSEFGFKVEGEREITKGYSLTRADKKAILRNFAEDWQRAFDCFRYSWGELAEWQTFFKEYGKRFGLLREFRENGII